MMTLLTQSALKDDITLENEKVTLVVPPLPAYVSVVRLSMAAVANRCGFTVEEIEDIKIAVAEAVTNAIVHCCDCTPEGVKIQSNFNTEQNELTISVSDQGPGFEATSVKLPDFEFAEEGGLGLFIIRSLMDEVELRTKPGQGTQVVMKKKLGDKECQ